jgi:hypothetical protein
MESRRALKERLIREGRWDAFVARREDLKCQGLEPKAAWEQTIHEFEQVSEQKQTGVAKSADSTDGSGDVSAVVLDCKVRNAGGASPRKVVEWVFDNLLVDSLKPDDAPSPGAWALLQDLKQYPDLRKEFYRSIWSKLLPTKTELDAAEKFSDDGREQIKLIERVRQASKDTVQQSGS